MSKLESKPIVIKTPSRRRCMICVDKEISSWIADCLKMTEGSGEPKPSARLVHSEIRKMFTDRAPAHENSTRRHLNDHDEFWGGWDD